MWGGGERGKGVHGGGGMIEEGDIWRGRGGVWRGRGWRGGGLSRGWVWGTCKCLGPLMGMLSYSRAWATTGCSREGGDVR